MKHRNVSIFIPHAGCPYRCAFCDQRLITAQQKLPHAQDVQEICTKALSEMPDTSGTEIAFFGGSFTAIPEGYMLELLQAAQPFLGEGKFQGIRISTRPDCITPQVLKVLQTYHVTAIELGAQSLSDRVLQANDRGHTAEDVFRSARLIQDFGFELGLQVMPGLYRSTVDHESLTLNSVCAMHPDTVRIYPVVILQGTRLAELYQSGDYQPMPFPEMVEMVAGQMRCYMEDGIRIIKVGLHASEFVQASAVGGYYHPAFRELCESEMFKLRMESAIMALQWKLHGFRRQTVWTEDRVFAVHPTCISKAIGQKKSNLRYFKEYYGMTVKVIGDESVPPFQCVIRNP